jgi:hypothetical protein
LSLRQGLLDGIYFMGISWYTPTRKTQGWVWKSATSKAEPRQQQDWISKCLQGV